MEAESLNEKAEVNASWVSRENNYFEVEARPKSS